MHVNPNENNMATFPDINTTNSDSNSRTQARGIILLTMLSFIYYFMFSYFHNFIISYFFKFLNS